MDEVFCFKINAEKKLDIGRRLNKIMKIGT